MRTVDEIRKKSEQFKKSYMRDAGLKQRITEKYLFMLEGHIR